MDDHDQFPNPTDSPKIGGSETEGWQPIATAPRDGTRIEVFAPSMGISVAWWIAASSSWNEDLDSGYMVAFQNWTHWRPITHDR